MPRRQFGSLANLGGNSFDEHAMRGAVSSGCMAEFLAARSSGAAVSKKCANEIADAMRNWAMARGAFSFAHWFSPIRGGNGLKYDMFLDYDWGGPGQNNGTVKDLKVAFEGSRLFFNETDGSSFPNGGLRVTHRAAAFMNWDRLSPPFVRNGVLYIPSSFVTHNGDAIDEKTPLLRSQESINREGVRLQHLLGDTAVNEVVANVGWEQEFFAIDRDDFLARPDLVAAGRTVIGASPPRGQQTDFNYFNRMNPRVRAFMDEFTAEALASGVPVTVFHNEVAPSQHEFSPIFKLTNIANDENTLSMEIMEDLAAKHNLAVLFHEKPFAGINGSGKHNNWGVNTDTGRNLFVPGKTDQAQASFVAMVAALTRTLHVHGDAVRTGVAVSGNDHRLGAQEAPPAIISLYTGDLMEAHLDKVRNGGELAGYGQATADIDFGTRAVSPIQANLEDRNRTAPFPFCGNRFEFRAVGSSQNIALPLTILNTAFAESMGVLSDKIEATGNVRDAVAETLNEHWPVIFNGNGYSEEWPVEAASRGLKNLKCGVDAWETFTSDKNAQLFSSQGVFNENELHSRQEIAFEKLAADIVIEADVLIDMMNTGVIPACAQDLANYNNSSLAGARTSTYEDLAAATAELESLRANIPDGTPNEVARYAQDVLRPQFDKVRALSDRSEGLVQRDLWPYPKYADMLFHHHSESA
jgi:glutamine synthetase